MAGVSHQLDLPEATAVAGCAQVASAKAMFVERVCGLNESRANSEVIWFPVSHGILPIQLDELDQVTSFDGSVLESWGAVLSNEDPQRYQRPVHPFARLQGCEITRRPSMN